MITPDILKKILKKNHSDAFLKNWSNLFNATLPRFAIDTPERVAAFIAQVAHESAEFTRMVENLNYSAEGLAATWPNRFKGPDGSPNELALTLHRRPEYIANVVYAGRLGNGNQQSGDGWKYRGRGLIQITGATNYRQIGDMIKRDLINEPDLVATPSVALETACAFWKINDLNRHIAVGNFRSLTRAINGGHHGLEDRLGYHERAVDALKG